MGEVTMNIRKFDKKIEVLVDQVVEECDDETRESARKMLEEMVQKAIDSYKGNFDDFRICGRCGLPMRYKSMAYDEEYHFDSCW
jgi:RNA polymerase-binding transcription factor DksA